MFFREGSPGLGDRPARPFPPLLPLPQRHSCSGCPLLLAFHNSCSISMSSASPHLQFVTVEPYLSLSHHLSNDLSSAPALMPPSVSGVWPWHTCGGLVCRSGPSWASSEIGVMAGLSCSSVPIRISANPLSQSRLIVLVFILLFPLGVSLQPMLVYVGGRFLVQLLTSYQCW